MNDIKIVEVTNRAQLNELYDDSALTLEGLAEESIPEFLNWIEAITPLKQRVVYTTKGSVMNTEYGLTGNNAYSSDLTLVSVKLTDIENAMATAIPRFDIGGRWFDDIVENNKRRQDRE